MKKNLKNKKVVSFKEQFGMGGPVLDYIKSPTTALQEDQLAWTKAKAEGATDPAAQTLDILGPILGMIGEVAASQGAFDKEEQAAMGMSTGRGKSFSVEGGEILETAKGDVLKIKGPKHEKGGVPLEISEEDAQKGNYNVYSDRIIGHTGKTLAKEKEEREKKIKRYEDHLKKFPGDIAAANTLERLRKSSKLADQNAVTLQSQLRDAYNQGNVETQVSEAPAQEGTQAAVGLSTGDSNLLSTLLLLNQIQGTNNPEGVVTLDEAQLAMDAKDNNYRKPPRDTSIKTFAEYNGPEGMDELGYRKNTFGAWEQQASDGTWKNATTGKDSTLPFTIGDGIGMISMAAQRIAARNAAANNAKRLDLEENIYNRYGHDMVNAEQAKQLVTNLERDEADRRTRLDANRALDSVQGLGIQELEAARERIQARTDDTLRKTRMDYLKDTTDNQMSYAKILQAIQDKYLTEEKAVQERNEQRLDIAQSGLDKANIDMYGLGADLAKIANNAKLQEIMAKSVSSQSTNFNTDRYGNVGGNARTQNTFDANVSPEEVLRQANQKAQEETKQAGEAQTITTSAPATPVDRIVGDKFYPNAKWTPDKTSINNLLQEIQIKHPDLKLDVTTPENVITFQKIIGAKPDGKFGYDTYSKLIDYVSGMTGKKYDPLTGLTFSTGK